MKNQEFKIDTESGVVVFCQKSHGRVFTSKTKASDKDVFNVGIGQLITMKRNEIAIRKVDIQSMLDVAEKCRQLAKESEGSTAQKLYSYFVQIACDKVNMSRNHIKELKTDLDTLYNGTFEVKPYAEIIEDHKIIRNGSDEEKKEVFKHPYAVPSEIMDGTHIFDIAGGTVVLKPVE